MSRKDIEKKVYSCASELLHEKGYVSPVDLLIKMDRLTKKQVEEWRFGKIPYLERVTIGNLSKLHHTLQTLEKFARKEELKSSKTVYMQWGKGAKRPLRFSKTGNPHMEGMYSTHYVRMKSERQTDLKSNG
ncbi:hypothetical protein CVD25_18105 [Bacillus canaveralius]|uniref:Uncharacterized protein n=1 Tax=Bacillus canaveralius TaxID=1403243 RepID=A0A2N5GSN8_9BACI|nr:hypothetical protein [Bacillus canaveralius]PLR86790.1 hypothetical protein CU635_00400 [Bacillus canaveralius]PLR92749.1 hypothetical protein CVD25_18105 [Bacillus canaveralius]